MCEVNHIVLMFKCVLPGEREVVPLVFALHAILVVANVNTTPCPSLTLFSRSFRVNQRPHSVIIKTVRLHKVDYVETVGFSSSCI